MSAYPRSNCGTSGSVKGLGDNSPPNTAPASSLSSTDQTPAAALTSQSLTITGPAESSTQRTAQYVDDHITSRPQFTSGSEKDRIDAHTSQQKAYLEAFNVFAKK